MTFQRSPRLIPLPECSHWLPQILDWNLQVWGERIPGYDRAGWRAFYQRALSSDYSRFLPGSELVWGIEIDANLVGSIALVGEDDLPEFTELTPWMAAFVIDPSLRHQGIGREVVGLFEQWCIDHDITTLYLWTDQYSRWYQSLGYREIARTRLAEIDAVVMTKDLHALP